MSGSRTTAKPIIETNGSAVTNVGVSVGRNTNKSHSYVGAAREPVAGGTSTFFAGTSKDISSSSTVGARAVVDTKGTYNVGISYERKF